MSLRHWPIFNGAPMAQRGLRHCHRRPKGKPMAHRLRLWFFPNGAPMAQWRTAGGKKSDPLVCMNCSEGTSGHWRLAPGARMVTSSLAQEAVHERPSQSPTCCRPTASSGEGRLDERRRAAVEQRLVVDRTGSWAGQQVTR
jgi:hypothetical protein